MHLGQWSLPEESYLEGPEQLYAMKAFKKRNITSSTICDIMAEKEALMLTSGHPFVTTLYSCFQNEACLNFGDFLHSFKLCLILKFTVIVKI